MEPGIEIASHLAVGDFAHAAAERVADDRPLVNDGLALKVLVPGKGHCLPNPLLWIELGVLVLRAFARHADHSLGLVAVLSGEFAVSRHDFTERVNFLAVARRMGGNFGGLFPVAAGTLQVFTDLLAAGTRCVKVLLRVALDLRRAASSRGDLVAELAQPVGQLRLINGRGELLRSEETLRLQGAVFPRLALRDIEDDGVGMELRSGVAVHGPGGVMLEFGGNEFGRGLRRMVPANPGHRVVLQVFKGDPDALAVRRANAVVTADQCGQRDGLWRGKGRIPPGAMFHRLDRLCHPHPCIRRRRAAAQAARRFADAGPG